MEKKISITDFYKKMLEFFPLKEEEFIIKTQEFIIGLDDTAIIEYIFMPELIEKLKKNSDTATLRNIFIYFENILSHADEYMLNTFFVTILEILGNDKKILKTATKYMGPETIRLQYEADKGLGRNV